MNIYNIVFKDRDDPNYNPALSIDKGSLGFMLIMMIISFIMLVFITGDQNTLKLIGISILAVYCAEKLLDLNNYYKKNEHSFYKKHCRIAFFLGFLTGIPFGVIGIITSSLLFIILMLLYYNRKIKKEKATSTEN